MVVEPIAAQPPETAEPTQPPPPPIRPVRARADQRRADRQSALVVAVLGVSTVIPFTVWIYRLQSQDRSAAALAMPAMHMERMGVFWAFPLLQAAGLAALLWAYLGVALGLAQSGRPLRWLPLAKGQVDRLHRQISLLVIGLIAVHVVATTFDAMGDDLKTVLVPWQESWTAAVFAYNLGIFAFYLALLLGPTYYLHGRVGARAWRFAHRFVLVVYVLSVWHTLILGADVEHYGWVRPAIWLVQLPLLVLFARRLAQPPRGPRRLSVPAPTVGPPAGSRPAREPVPAPELVTWRDRMGVAVRCVLAAACVAAAVGIVVIVAGGQYASLVRTIQ